MANTQFDHAQAQEIIRFQISYNKRQIKATWALGAAIALLFFLEEFFGGSQNISVLVRMGANVSERVVAGEYFRLMSSVFLHAGWMHVFFNTYVLFALGGFFNRILGESKYLTVFFVSGITGSCASVFLGSAGVSVGASGAIWGLFGSSLVLGIFKTNLLPDPIRLRLRRITLINLIINLGISFLPMIDFWAHIGGGIGGFLVTLLIIKKPRNRTMYRIGQKIFVSVASVLVVLYAMSIGTALWTFQPWHDPLVSKSLEHVELDDVPFSISVPSGLQIERGQKNTATSSYYVFGDLSIDGIALEVHFFHQAVLGTRADSDWLKRQRQELMKEPALSAQVKKTIDYRERSSGNMLYYQQFPKNAEVIIHNYLVTQGEYAVKIGVITVKKAAQQKIEAIATRIIESIASSNPK